VPYNNKGVRVLVGKDHNEVVNQPDKHVFVEYYAPWCGHCKHLAPIWEELAAAYDSHDNILIAKMDSTENEVDTVDIRGFPTLIFYPAGANKKSEVYDGDRELEALKNFIEKKTQVSGEHDKDEL